MNSTPFPTKPIDVVPLQRTKANPLYQREIRVGYEPPADHIERGSVVHMEIGRELLHGQRGARERRDRLAAHHPAPVHRETSANWLQLSN